MPYLLVTLLLIFMLILILILGLIDSRAIIRGKVPFYTYRGYL